MQINSSSAAPVGITDVSLTARARWHRSVAAVIGLWLLLAAGLLLASWRGLPVVWWDLIHSLALGVVATAILAYTTHFTEALTRTAPAPYRWVAFRIAVVQACLIGLLIDRAGFDWGPLADAAAAAVIATFAVHAFVLARRLRGSLAGSFVATVPFYLAACFFLAVGVFLAAAAGRGMGDYDALIAAHSRAMVWGFGWLCIVGTAVTLLPTIAGAAISATARARMPRALSVHVLGLLFALTGFATDIHLVAGLGLLAVTLASLLILVPVVAWTRKGNGNRWASASACAGLAWLTVALLADAACACAGVFPRQVTLGVVAPLLGAGLVQLILAVLSHLGPTLRGGGPDVVLRARARAQAGAAVRLGLVNAGAALALVSGAVAALPGGVTIPGGVALGITMMASGIFIGAVALAWALLE